MRITYYAVRPLTVGDEIRQPGDLVPEAAEFAALSGYMADGKIAPVLVATLPVDTQKMLLEWEKEQHPEEVAAGVVVEEQPKTVEEPVKAPRTAAKVKPKSDTKEAV